MPAHLKLGLHALCDVSHEGARGLVGAHDHQLYLELPPQHKPTCKSTHTHHPHQLTWWLPGETQGSIHSEALHQAHARTNAHTHTHTHTHTAGKQRASERGSACADSRSDSFFGVSPLEVKDQDKVLNDSPPTPPRQAHPSTSARRSSETCLSTPSTSSTATCSAFSCPGREGGREGGRAGRESTKL